MFRVIRQVLLFVALLRTVWMMAGSLAMTNSTQKSILLETEVGSLANAVSNIVGQGGVSPGTPGGAPSLYTPSYESQLSACLQSVINKLNAAGIT